MSGGLFADALEHIKDRQEWKKLLVHERGAVRWMFDERESERFAQLFHRRTVDKLRTQLDGVIRDAPVAHSANTPARLCVSLQANRVDAKAPRLRQGRNSRHPAPEDEKIRFRSQLSRRTHRTHSSDISNRLYKRRNIGTCAGSLWSFHHRDLDLAIAA